MTDKPLWTTSTTLPNPNNLLHNLSGLRSDTLTFPDGHDPMIGEHIEYCDLDGRTWVGTITGATSYGYTGTVTTQTTGTR